MKTRFAAVLVLLMAGLWVAPSFAQDDPKPVAAGEMDTNKDGKVDADETKTEVAKDVSAIDVADDVTDVVEKAQDLKGSSGGKALLIMALLGAIFKALLSALKLVKKETNWFKAKKAKRILKYSTVVLGGLAALMSNAVLGMGWIESLTILVSGPLAVALHEYLKDSKDPTGETPANAEG